MAAKSVKVLSIRLACVNRFGTDSRTGQATGISLHIFSTEIYANELRLCVVNCEYTDIYICVYVYRRERWWREKNSANRMLATLTGL